MIATKQTGKMAEMVSIPTIFCAFVLFVAGSASSFAQTSTTKTFTPVLELFTSQGCSSCPPADRHLGELQNRTDLVTLSFPVDYWDYLGWSDTLASPENAVRQRLYAKKNGSGAVYTPQVVVNGVTHAVGSRPAEVEHAIKMARSQLASRAVAVHLHMQKKNLVVETEAASAPSEPATVWLALISKVKKVMIKRGENSGRTIAYYNVVHKLKKVGEWNGLAEKLVLPVKDMLTGDADTCAILIQEGAGGPILGAAYMHAFGS